MKELVDFLTFAEPNIKYVVWGAILLGAISGMVGCFTLLRKRALVGDAVAHSILPGICLAFIISQTKNPFFLLTGAIGSGWLSLWLIDVISRNSKIKSDAAIGIVLTTFFGIGILLLTHIQSTGNSNQSGLNHYLFGQAATMSSLDLYTFLISSIFITLIIISLFKEFKLVSFNRDFAVSIGLPVKFFEFLISIITVLAIAIGIKAVGVVLMAALLITPAATAKLWTHNLRKMLILACLLGAVGGYLGALVSFLRVGMPTGPWIVCFLSFFAFTSIFIAPNKGILARAMLKRHNQRKILEENVLKALYHLGEKQNDFMYERSIQSINEHRKLGIKNIKAGLKILNRKHLVIRSKENNWKFTQTGLEHGKKVVRLHRLWELYLTTKLRMEADHVHEGAEAIEHIITPEIEALLEKELNSPKEDPHKSIIPS